MISGIKVNGSKKVRIKWAIDGLLEAGRIINIAMTEPT